MSPFNRTFENLPSTSLLARWFCAALAVAALSPVDTAAQFHEALPTGARVRVWATSPPLARPLVGRIGSVRDQLRDTLVLQAAAPAEDLRVPASAVTRLELSVGDGGDHGWRGAGIGMVAGIGFGILVSAQVPTGSAGPCDSSSCAKSWNELGGWLYGGLSGAVIGGVIGNSIHSELWTRVPQVGTTAPIVPQFSAKDALSELAPGSVLRVAYAGQLHYGALGAVTADSLYFDSPDTESGVPLTDVRGIWVRQRSVGRAAAAGALAGAVFIGSGYLLGVSTCSCDGTSSTMMATAIGAGAGALLGTIVGLVRSEWRDVYP